MTDAEPAIDVSNVTCTFGRVRALDGTAVATLHGRGFLEPLYMVVASTVHFRSLIDRRNRRL